MSNLRTRRDLLRALGASAAGAPLAVSLFAQGRCQSGYNTPGCPMTKDVATAPIKPLFAPTGWKTVALEHISFQVPDYRKEARLYYSEFVKKPIPLNASARAWRRPEAPPA